MRHFRTILALSRIKIMAQAPFARFRNDLFKHARFYFDVMERLQGSIFHAVGTYHAVRCVEAELNKRLMFKAKR